MPKFNIGDKVRWGKAVGERVSVHIGGIFTIQSVNEQGHYTLEFGHGAHAHDIPEDELELVENNIEIKP